MIKNKKQAIQNFMDGLCRHHDQDGFFSKYHSRLTRSHYFSKTEAKNHYIEYHKENLIIFQGNIFKLDYIANMMDDDIRESVHGTHCGATAQKFFDRYCKLHIKKYKSEFVID